MTSTPGLPIHTIKSSMRAAWMAGDFGQVAKTISSGAEAFVQRLALPSGTRVLDVACGTGNLAIPMARAGCQVTGVDIAPNLLAQARERAAAEHLVVTFDEGDAEQLPYPDQSFDAVVTMFGACLHLGRSWSPANLRVSSAPTAGWQWRTGLRKASPPPCFE